MSLQRNKIYDYLCNGKSVNDRDVLKAIITNAFGEKNAEKTADILLARFPSVGAILHADVDEMLDIDGVSNDVMLYLKAVGLTMGEANADEEGEIHSREDFERLLLSRFVRLDNEFIEFYMIDESGKIIFSKRYTSDSKNAVGMYADEFLMHLTSLKPYGLYFAHNHVDSPALPSSKDDILTLKIASFCMRTGTKFFDHGIVNSKNQTYSYSQSGRLKKLVEEQIKGN